MGPAQPQAFALQQDLVKGGEKQPPAIVFLLGHVKVARTRSDLEDSPSSLTLASSSVPVSMAWGLR